MIEKILPDAVASSEAFDDPPDAVLFPAEAVVISRAVEKRRRVGIDAEPHEPLPPDVAGAIALDEELVGRAELTAADSAVCWDRLLFSAKETVYKAWFPLTHRWLGFEQASITIDPR